MNSIGRWRDLYLHKLYINCLDYAPVIIVVPAHSVRLIPQGGAQGQGVGASGGPLFRGLITLCRALK